MSPLDDCCYMCRRCSWDTPTTVCRDSQPLLPDDLVCDSCAVHRCGRMDLHDEHEWRTSRGAYVCSGQVLVAGAERVVA